MASANLNQLYQVESPLAMAQSLSGSSANKFSTAIQGRQQEASMAPPEKTAGGGVMQAGGGAATGASVGTAMAEAGMAGSSAGLWGAAIGAGVGALGYFLS